MKIKDAIHWIDIARMGYICDPNECGLEKGGDPCKVFHCDEIHDALVIAMDTLKKHTPTKPNWLYDDEPLCPYCQCVLEEYEEVCGECTQLIDWSDTE